MTRTGKTDRAKLLRDWLETATPARLQPAVLSANDRELVLKTWNQTTRPYRLDRSVTQWFEEQAAERPDAIALEDPSGTMSYAELNRRANRVAHRLLLGELKPSEVVAIRFDRSMAFVIAALGVMKAGGAYMPLDLQVPSQRQKWILEDCGARFAFMTSSHRETFSNWNGQALLLEDRIAPAIEREDTNPQIPSEPHRLAYVIYTSGSMGAPKGVEIEHRSLSNLIHFYHERLEMSTRDRPTLVANPVFDASVADLWPGLCAGATVLIPGSDDLKDPDRFIEWLARRGATYSFAPTAFGEILLSRQWPDRMALRHLALGGETLRTYPPPGLPFEVLNTYGPTENTVDSIWAVVPPLGETGCPPIGRPISNVVAYVLDEHLAPVPPNTVGELYLAGQQVARGYRNRPQLTRQLFIPDPFAAGTGARMYRTGDRVRWNGTGELEFLGRLDDQVQIRGQRVELGEIETTLRRCQRAVKPSQ